MGCKINYDVSIQNKATISIFLPICQPRQVEKWHGMIFNSLGKREVGFIYLGRIYGVTIVWQETIIVF